MVDDLLSVFRRHVLALNGPVTPQPSHAAVTVFGQLMDSPQQVDQEDILQALFHFLKFPQGQDGHSINEGIVMPADADPFSTSLYKLVDLQEPFSSTLGLPALRNWFQLFNAIVNISIGSERRLKFKYSSLPPLAVVVYYTPRFQPEFLSRLSDYVQGWRRRLVFDSEALDILGAAFRGESRAIEKALCHADGEIASHFILLREEFLRRGGNNEAPEADNSSSILPSYLYEVMQAWAAESDGSGGGCGVSSGSNHDQEGDVAEWYRSILGEKLLSSIREGRNEVENRYEPLFPKYREAWSGGAVSQSARGQVIVLLKKEFKRRVELMEEELQLVSMIDSRHALLTRKLNTFARLSWHLETAKL